MIAAAFAPTAVLASPLAVPAVANKLGRGLISPIFYYVDDSPIQSMGYSVAYNLQATRHDEFGEVFYPTVVVKP